MEAAVVGDFTPDITAKEARQAGHQERGINVKTVCSGILHL